MLAVDSQVPLFLLVENLAFTPRDGAHEQRKRKHGNHAIHFVTLFDSLIKIQNLDGLVWTIFGGRNPKVGVNHVKFGCLICISLLCSFMYFVCMMMML